MSISRPQAEESFERRWSPEVAKKGFYQKPRCFSTCLSKLGLTVQEGVVLDVLFSFAYSNNELPSSYPATSTIGDALGMAYSTVGTHIRNLEKKGFIKRVFRDGNSNLYKLGPSITIIRRHVLSEHPPQYQGGSRPKTRRLPHSNMRTKEEALKKNYIKKTGPVSAKEILSNKMLHNRNDI